MIERYEDPRMRAIWDRNNQIYLWSLVELAWMSHHSAEGYEAVRDVPMPTAGQVATRELKTRHEFTAFLDEWVERFGQDADGDEARRWVHYGLTSSDVIDTATAIQLRDSNEILIVESNALLGSIAAFAQAFEGIEQVGRTHGQWAQPRDASIQFEVIGHMLGRQTRRLRSAAVDLEQADLSGPTGARIGLDPTKVRATLSLLGLTRAPASTQIVPRDSLVAWAHAVSGLTTVCAAFAEQVWLLAQSDVAELMIETRGTAPSSAMPHKRNPAVAENIMGLARLARALAGSLDQSIIQRGDRDLAHSSVERVAVPDLCHLAATTLHQTQRLVMSLIPHHTNIEAAIDYATPRGARSHEAVMESVRQGSSRADAMKKENPNP